ncbi:MAG TPA: thiamine-phosphate kinase [Steroidobacteraceae bacterium]|nr:thiamine-phosphate kinase [Steroidobacteraceae bacterium]
MPLSEFDLIARFFSDCGARRADVTLGVGDDAALLEVPAGRELVAAIDTLVEGVHFPAGSPAASIGHRALAVNLSDLAAMGAEPAWALLALTMPRAEQDWLSEFADGFAKLARAHRVALVGGDTTAGPLSVTVQAMGFVEPGTALRRAGGSAGDVLFVSGTPGEAAAGLEVARSAHPPQAAAEAAQLRSRFEFPEPRIALGRRLRGIASACIDVSDGLLADAGKLAAASGCGTEIDYEAVPVSTALRTLVGEERARSLVLTGGDDYELCFAVPVAKLAILQRELPTAAYPWQRIGVLRREAGTVVKRAGTVMDFSARGYDHFA